jgi:hypothetical protein
MTPTRMVLPTLVCILLSSGCKAKEQSPPAQPPAAEQAEAPAPDTTGGMGGMAGMSSGATDEMRSHMSTMMGAAADSMAAMLPAHRQMVANMLAQFGREMRDMNMTADAAWNALADSVRTDLTRLPELNPTELETAMAAHAARVQRLMEMHQRMGGTKM